MNPIMALVIAALSFSFIAHADAQTQQKQGKGKWNNDKCIKQNTGLDWTPGQVVQHCAQKKMERELKR